jgi:hypothetical protein
MKNKIHGDWAMDGPQSRAYEEGVQDGRLKALEHRVDGHDTLGESRERRLQVLERILYGLVGIVTFTTVLPGVIDTFLGIVN